MNEIGGEKYHFLKFLLWEKKWLERCLVKNKDWLKSTNAVKGQSLWIPFSRHGMSFAIIILPKISKGFFG